MAENAPMEGTPPESQPQDNIVRLRGLPFSATEADILEFFKGYELGPDGVVIQLNYQGRATGQAFVQLKSTEEATRALEKNRQHIGSRYIEVYKGHAADMEGALRMVGRGKGGSAFGNTNLGGAGNSPLAVAVAASMPTARGLGGLSVGNSDLRYSGVVRMRGMPYSCSAADITAFFKDYQIAPDGIFLCSHPDGRPTGEAFVEFVSEEVAAQAMQLHREPMGSRYVELFRSTKGEMLVAIQHKSYGGYSMGAGAFGGGAFGGAQMLPGMMGGYGLQNLGAANLAALQMATLQAQNFSGMGAGGGAGLGAAAAGLGIASVENPAAAAPAVPNENVCIKMRGLPFNAGQTEILEFFHGYEVVANGIHVVTGPNDRPTGEAFVEFSSADEAARAMIKHRQNIGSRYIELFRASKTEALLAVQGGALAGFNMAAALDPNMQLLLLQQQQLQAAAAAGQFSMPQGWGNANDVASFYQRQVAAAQAMASGNAAGAYDPSHHK